MILILLLILMGIHNQIYNSYNFQLQDPILTRQQSIGAKSSICYQPSYGSNDLYEYRQQPNPKNLYYEDYPNDRYELYMQAKEKDPNKCKKITYGTIGCSTILSIMGCFLFHHI